MAAHTAVVLAPVLRSARLTRRPIAPTVFSFTPPHFVAVEAREHVAEIAHLCTALLDALHCRARVAREGIILCSSTGARSVVARTDKARTAFGGALVELRMIGREPFFDSAKLFSLRVHAIGALPETYAHSGKAHVWW